MRGRRGPSVLAGAAVFLFTLALAAGAGVSRLEERDSFCIACHTTPELTYYQRAQQALAGEQPYLDLSSAHYGLAEGGFRCIDCHRGDGSLAHRLATLALGARDALIWAAGQADPTIEKTTLVAPQLLTEPCLQCHTQALLVAGFDNHFHNKLPDAFRAWQAGGTLVAPSDLPSQRLALDASETTVLCVDCHRAHINLPGSELRGYLNLVGIVYPACVKCHREAGSGPLDLVQPGGS